MASALHDLRAMLAALQKAMDEKMSGGEDLAALQKKIAEMSAQQVAQTAQLDKAWGYITADEAAEEVVQQAFGNEEEDQREDDELYNQLVKRTKAIAGS